MPHFFSKNSRNLGRFSISKEYTAPHERARPFVEAALHDGGGRWTFEDVIAEIEAGEAHLWRFERSVVVTRFLDEPAGRTLFYWLAGGDLEEIKAREPDMTAWGKSQGCNRKMLVGRRGWEKALGWKVAGVMLAEDIK